MNFEGLAGLVLLVLVLEPAILTTQPFKVSRLLLKIVSLIFNKTSIAQGTLSAKDRIVLLSKKDLTDMDVIFETFLMVK